MSTSIRIDIQRLLIVSDNLLHLYEYIFPSTKHLPCALAAGSRGGAGASSESLTRPEIDGYWKRFVASEQAAAAARHSGSLSGSGSGTGSGSDSGPEDDERPDGEVDVDEDEGFPVRRRKRRTAHKSKMEQVPISH